MRSSMMMFTIVAVGVFGIWLTFAPASYLALAGLPEEAMTGLVLLAVGCLGAQALVTSYWIFNARGLAAGANTERMMLYHALGWFVAGAGGLYQVMRYGDPSAGKLLTWQFAVFVLIAVAFFVMKGRED